MASIIWVVCLNNMEALGEAQNPSDQMQVVWPERHNGNLDIYFSRLTASGWTTKIPLSEAPATELMPAIAAGSNGVSWVVWTADSGTKGSDLFYVYSREGGWSDPARIPTGLLFNTAPSIKIDEEDRPWIAWSGSDGKGSDIYFSRWNGNDWEKASRVNQADSTPDIMPLIGTDWNGSPWICWFGFDGNQYRTYASKWTSEKWSDEIESDEDNLYKLLTNSGYRAAKPMLLGLVSEPDADKAGVYIPRKDQLNSIPIRYLELGNLNDRSAPSGPRKTEEAESSTGLVIICFGDSITQGFPYITTEGNGRRVGGYEPPLETLLAADSRPSQALNWGVGGETTWTGAQRIDDVLHNSGAEYVLILEGTNDYWLYTYTDTIFNLGNMIDKSREENVTPIIATLTPDTKNPEKPIDTTYNPAIKGLAVEKGVILADQYAALIDQWISSYNYDGLHPNTAGYQAMAQVWFNAIPGGPDVTTGEATSIGYTSVLLNGTINPNGSATTYYFEYGTTTAYGKSTPSTSAGSGTSTLAVNTSVTGLISKSLYHYRLRATNSGGTVFGADRTFTTQELALPDVTTGEATFIGYTSVRLNGTINPNGSATTCYFEYGATTAYGKSTPSISAGSGTSTLGVNTSVTGLTNETLYHYRLRATNSGGTAFGDDLTFTTHRPTCDGCIGDVVLLDGVTYGADTDCECIAGTSITIGPDVTIESGAHVTFIAPRVIIKSGFNAKSGSVVDIVPP